MKLSSKTKKTGLKNILDFSQAKSSIHSKRVPDTKKRSLGDFSFGFDKKRDKKGGTKSERIKRIAKKIAIFSSLAFLFIALFGILAVLGIVSAYSRDLPNVDKYLQDSTIIGKESIIVDRNGKELYRIRGNLINERLTISELPDKMKWAVLSTEEANFDTNQGIDLYGVTRSLLCIGGNYVGGNKSFDGCGGGSTVTQQLIKLTTVGNQRTAERKITEAILAMNVSKSYSKNQILEYYLNIIPEGAQLVGIKSGAKYLFGKSDLSTLTLAETAYLAGIPNQPDVYSPIGGNYDPTASLNRASFVLDRMYENREHSGVTKEEIDEAKAQLPYVKFSNYNVSQKAPHFTNEVLGQLTDIFADQAAANPDKYKTGLDYLKDKGYTITTTVDLTQQELLENSIRTNIASSDFQKNTESQNAAGVIMDVKTGEVLALVGSKDFYATSSDPRFAPKHNAAMSALSMGSSVKVPLYLTAFTKGYNPLSVVPNLRLDQRAEGSSTEYFPSNYGQDFALPVDANRTGRGDFISFRQALRQSLNQPAVSAYQLVGNDAFADMYVRLTGDESIRSRFVGPSAAIGTANISLAQQVHAYATIADGGNYHPQKFILEIKDENGQIIYDNRKVESKQVVDAKYTFLITDMNKDYGSFAYTPYLKQLTKKVDFAGKSGTSDGPNGPGDIVFIGYTPDVVIGMWSGNSCGVIKCPMKWGANSDYIFNDMYIPFLKEYNDTIGFKPGRFTPPAGVKNVAICALTGNEATPDCTAAGGKIINDWVADSSKPPSENMIIKVKVTPCPGVDSMKLARQVDIDAGLAQDRYYVQYDKIFARKFMSDQIKAYLLTRNELLPTEQCAIDRAVNPPQITVVSPQANQNYTQADVVSVNALVTADLPLTKVELFLDGVLQKTFNPGDPYQVDLPLTNVSLGTHSITIIATDNKGQETTAQKTINVVLATPTPSPTGVVTPAPSINITQPTNGASLNGPINNYTIKATFVNATCTTLALSCVTFTVIDTSNGNPVTPAPVTQTVTATGATAIWDVPAALPANPKSYKIRATMNSTSGTLIKDVLITVN